MNLSASPRRAGAWAFGLGSLCLFAGWLGLALHAMNMPALKLGLLWALLLGAVALAGRAWQGQWLACCSDGLGRWNWFQVSAGLWFGCLAHSVLLKFDGRLPRVPDWEGGAWPALACACLMSLLALALQAQARQRKQGLRAQPAVLALVAARRQMRVEELRPWLRGLLLQRRPDESLLRSALSGDELESAERLDAARLLFACVLVLVLGAYLAPLWAGLLQAWPQPAWVGLDEALPWPLCLALLVAHGVLLASDWWRHSASDTDAPVQGAEPTREERLMGELQQAALRSEALLASIERSHAAQLRGTDKLLHALTRLVEQQALQQSRGQESLESALRELAGRLGSGEASGLGTGPQRGLEQMERTARRLEELMRHCDELSLRVGDRLKSRAPVWGSR